MKSAIATALAAVALEVGAASKAINSWAKSLGYCAPQLPLARRARWAAAITISEATPLSAEEVDAILERHERQGVGLTESVLAIETSLRMRC